MNVRWPCLVVLLIASISALPAEAKDRPLTIAAPPSFAWRLPKTVLDVTVTYVPSDCEEVPTLDPTDDPGKKEPLVTFTAKVDMVARSVPDQDLGPGFANGLVTIDRETKGSFWIDKSVSYTVYAGRGGLLQSLTSHPIGQAGTIISNVLSGIEKIASAALIAGPQPSQGHELCGKKLHDAVVQLKKLQAVLPTASDKDRSSIAASIQSLKDAVTISVSTTIDPGRGKDGQINPIAKVGAANFPLEWRVATVAPDTAKYVAAGWYEPGSVAAGRTHTDQHVSVFLDFNAAALLDPNACPKIHNQASKVADVSADSTISSASPNDQPINPNGGGATAGQEGTCAPAPLAPAALFRQAAYIRVYAKRGEYASKTTPTDNLVAAGDAQIVAFGQFGVGRGIPLSTGAFKDQSWEVNFSDLGEITKASFAKKATGSAITGAFANAAGTAETAAGLPSKAAGQLDSETLRLQAENAALKAQIDNRTYKQQLEAAGQPTDSPK